MNVYVYHVVIKTKSSIERRSLRMQWME